MVATPELFLIDEMSTLQLCIIYSIIPISLILSTYQLYNSLYFVQLKQQINVVNGTNETGNLIPMPTEKPTPTPALIMNPTPPVMMPTEKLNKIPAQTPTTSPTPTSIAAMSEALNKSVEEGRKGLANAAINRAAEDQKMVDFNKKYNNNGVSPDDLKDPGKLT
jgi:hypothetical protein